MNFLTPFIEEILFETKLLAGVAFVLTRTSGSALVQQW